MTEEVYTRDEEKSLKVGLWVALSIILIVGLISSARQKITHVDSGSYYPVMARFNRTDGLLVGDLVRLAGVNVGKVVDAKLDDDFKAIQNMIDSVTAAKDWESTVLAKTNLLHEAAKYLAEENGREATPWDLAEYTKIPLAEIHDLLDLRSTSERKAKP